MTLTAGTRLGPYELGPLIGRGGMGEVYRGRDTRLGRDVAIKFLPAASAENLDRLKRFEHEARVVSGLNHPNIVTVHDLGTHEGAPFLVMELLEGETLRGRFAGKPLPVRQALELSLQIIRGLAAAHQKGILHRDLKPENIFLTKDGRVKILDFGLAKLRPLEPLIPGLGPGEAATAPMAGNIARTEAGLVMGTVTYMSPEQARGEPMDGRSDLFSLGLVLWETLTGHHPFLRRSSLETLHAILNEELPALAPETPIPLPLQRILATCLAKDPDLRFHSAHDLAFAIEEVAGSGSASVLARPPAVAVRARFPWPALAVGLGLGFCAALWGYLRPSRPLPTFQQLTFTPGTVESAFFGGDGRSVFFTARFQGKGSEVFVLGADSAEPKATGAGNALLCSVSPTSELALLRAPRKSFSVTRGDLAQMPGWGGGIRDHLEDVYDAAWDPAGKSLVLVQFDGSRITLATTAGVTVTSFPNLFPPKFLRISTKGELALLVWDGTSTAIATFDRSGKRKDVFTSPTDGQGESITGLAWHPATGELWISEVQQRQTSFWALSDRGRRLVWRTYGNFQLLDIAPDGKLLAAHQASRRGVSFHRRGEADSRELAVLNSSTAMDLSRDGTRLLLLEGQSHRGRNAQDVAYVRGTDGSPAFRLAAGTPWGLSADGRFAALRPAPGLNETGERLELLTTGAGTPRSLPLAGLVSAEGAQFREDGKALYFAGNEPGKAARIYTLQLDDGSLRALTPAGTTFSYGAKCLSPDGKLIAAGSTSTDTIYGAEDGQARPLKGLLPGEVFIRWGLGSDSFYVFNRDALPTKIFRITAATGQRELVETFTPADPVGLEGIQSVKMTPDGTAFAYNYRRTLSDLYLVEGLK